MGLPHRALVPVLDGEPPPGLRVTVAQLDGVADGDVESPPLQAQAVVAHLQPGALGCRLELRGRHRLEGALHEGALDRAPRIGVGSAVEPRGRVDEAKHLERTLADELGVALLVQEPGDDTARRIEPDLDLRIADQERLLGLPEVAVSLGDGRLRRQGEQAQGDRDPRRRWHRVPPIEGPMLAPGGRTQAHWPGLTLSWPARSPSSPATARGRARPGEGQQHEPPGCVRPSWLRTGHGRRSR